MTLREVLDELAGGGEADPAGALADRGYGELPDPLLSEAIVSYADTAPVEVAEHLAPFVMVHSAVPLDRPGDVPAGDGLALLATAPEPILAEEPTEEPTEEPVAGSYDDLEFEFGTGAEPVGLLDEVEEWDGVETEPAPVLGDQFDPAELGLDLPEAIGPEPEAEPEAELGQDDDDDSGDAG